MSEEIGTPLKGLIGVTQLLQGTTLDSRQAKHVKTMRQSLEALTGVLQNLLEFARLEARGIEIYRSPMRPADAMREAVAAAREIAQAKSLELRFSLDSASDGVRMGDSALIRRVLEHLLNNAVKFTQAGMIRVSVEIVRPEDASQPDRARYEVLDSGIGMSEERVRSLRAQFEGETFRPIDRARGLGLGLSVSYHLVRLMGGQIEVSSQSGIGSKFSFEVPVGPLLTEGGSQSSIPFASGLAVAEQTSTRVTDEAELPVAVRVDEASQADHGAIHAPQ
jgi:signal transduction histidine kinase